MRPEMPLNADVQCRPRTANVSVLHLTALAFIAVSVLAVGGCSYTTHGPETELSRDGSRVAYVRAEKVDLPLPPELPTIYCRLSVCVYELNRPEHATIATIGSFGPKSSPENETSVSIRISPDGRHVLANGPHHLRLMEAKSGKMSLVSRPSETVTSAAWIGDDVIGYVVRRDRKGPSGKITVRSFVRQGVKHGLEKRSVIYTDEYWSIGGPEYWSPNGLYAICRAPKSGVVMMLDVRSGKTREFGEKANGAPQVSWKLDDSAVVCRNGVRTLLIETDSGTVTDLTRDVQSTFGTDPYGSRPQLAPLWTPDGRYVVMYGFKGLEGCLVQLRPWKVIRTARLALERLGVSNEQWPHLYLVPQAAAPWVSMWVAGTHYFVDYSGRHVIPTSSSNDWCNRWTLTPDGTRMFLLDSNNKLVVRPSSLPRINQ